MTIHLSTMIDNSIHTERELFHRFYSDLCFPDWFGFNWDALWDSLNDFQWNSEISSVVIKIKQWPDLNNQELKIFQSQMKELKNSIVTVEFPQ